MLIHRQQSHRTAGTFRSTRTNLTAGSSRTNWTAGTVFTAGTEGSFHRKPAYEAPKRLHETVTGTSQKSPHVMAVDHELDRVLERMDSVTDNNNKHNHGLSRNASRRQRNTPKRMFGFFRRRDGTKSKLPVKPKANSDTHNNKKKNKSEITQRGKGMLVAASESLQKKQYSTVAQPSLSREGNQRKVEKSTSSRGFDQRIDAAKSKVVTPDNNSSCSKLKVDRTGSSKPKTKRSSPSSEEELLGSILSIPMADLSESVSSKAGTASALPTANTTDKKNQLKKEKASCRSLLDSWLSEEENVFEVQEGGESISGGESGPFQLLEATPYTIPAPPTLQVTTSMSSASEWKTTVSVTTNVNGKFFSSPLKTWSTASMAERNGTPFVSRAKPKLFIEPQRLNKTDLISDSDSSDDEEWAKPMPMIQYTTSTSSVKSSLALEWTVAFNEGKGTPVGCGGLEQQAGKLCLNEAIPSPPLITLSSLSLKQPQRKKSLSTRAESPPTLEFTTSLDSFKSHWSYQSNGRHTIPAPPALDHPFHHDTNEIFLPAVSPSIPTNVVEIDGVDVQVRPLEEAILYVAAEVTGRCSSGSSRIVDTVCTRCSATNCHVCDCAYVLCPECHAVTPTGWYNCYGNSRSEQHHHPTPCWGVGLGFSPDLRTLWLDQLLGGDSR